MSRRSRQRQISDLAMVGKTTEGRRLIKRILDQSGVMLNPMTPGLPESSHYNMGMSSMGQWLWDELLEAAPEALAWYIGERAKEVKHAVDTAKTQKKETDDE